MLLYILSLCTCYSYATHLQVHCFTSQNCYYTEFFQQYTILWRIFSLSPSSFSITSSLVVIMPHLSFYTCHRWAVFFFFLPAAWGVWLHGSSHPVLLGILLINIFMHEGKKFIFLYSPLQLFLHWQHICIPKLVFIVSPVSILF